MELPVSATLNEPPTGGTYKFSQHPQWEYLPNSHFIFVLVVSSTLQVVRNWGYKTRQMYQITLHISITYPLRLVHWLLGCA